MWSLLFGLVDSLGSDLCGLLVRINTGVDLVPFGLLNGEPRRHHSGAQ